MPAKHMLMMGKRAMAAGRGIAGQCALTVAVLGSQNTNAAPIWMPKPSMTQSMSAWKKRVVPDIMWRCPSSMTASVMERPGSSQTTAERESAKKQLRAHVTSSRRDTKLTKAAVTNGRACGAGERRVRTRD